MKILYHHRTRATDAQKVHILEMIGAFRELGHEVTIASMVETENRSNEPDRDAKESGWKKLLRRIPFSSEAVQLGYNLFAGPVVAAQDSAAGRADFIYERYSLLNFSGVAAAALSGCPIVVEGEFATRSGDEAGRGNPSWPFRRVDRAHHLQQRHKGRSGFGTTAPNYDPKRRSGVEAVSHPQWREFAALCRRLGRPAPRIAWNRQSGCHRIRGLVQTLAWAGITSGGIPSIRSLGRSQAALLLVGDGPATKELKDYVAKMNLQDSVIFAGPVSHERIPAYLDLVDIAVQPAANDYCCPMKILEYMGLARAIVAPRQENIQELLDDGWNAVLFEPGNAGSLAQALVTLATDAARRADTGANARRTIHERGFLWESNAQRILEILRSEGMALAYE